MSEQLERPEAHKNAVRGTRLGLVGGLVVGRHGLPPPKTVKPWHLASLSAVEDTTAPKRRVVAPCDRRAEGGKHGLQGGME